jgi:prepilin signal peptidase PulO-like enzyme (type II secretory pathway)
MSGIESAAQGLGHAVAFLFGAIVGSFLNVVVARVPAGESIVHPRSRCPACRTPIAWYDNVPVLSWLLLRGRCRACRATISFRYPLVELLGGAAAGWLSFAAVSVAGEKVLRKEALGFGDVWLLGGIGAWVGVGGLLPVVLLASLQGTVIGLALILLGRGQPGPAPAAGPDPAATGPEVAPEIAPAPVSDADWVPPRNAVPFGPFLAAGALEWLWLQGWLAQVVPAMSIFR